MNSFLAPFKDSHLIKIFISIIAFLYAFIMNAQVEKSSDLYKILAAKDSILFERTFNKCEIEKLDTLIAENFEFYHDVAGIQNKEEFNNAVKNNICKNPGNMKRNLVSESLEVFPLKNNGVLYGAIQKGKHTFQEKQNGIFKTVGIANFTHVWILENSQWKLKRVLSYNHLPYTE
ncbi:nuclear transport factor 2 family protein [Polaribacter sp.]|uniref:nuclear transport factor 2 family protein n=1 Tax=Polaribacter sp. TaxID=1920175 RepID=UPI0040487A0A